jgi:predicted DNA-binding transcriptional regulator AlpA
MLEYLIREDELAEFLGKSKPTLQAWRARGQGPPWLKLVGRVFYDRRKVDEWIAANEHVPQRAA